MSVICQSCIFSSQKGRVAYTYNADSYSDLVVSCSAKTATFTTGMRLKPTQHLRIWTFQNTSR